ALALALAVGGVGAQTTIYEGRDAQGRPVFTDKPRAGDKSVELPPINTTPAGPTLQAAPPRTAPFAGYSATLSAPGSVPNDQVPVEIGIAIEPELREGDLWRLSIDGAFVAAGREAGYTVDSLARGRHTVALEITDAAGAVIGAAAPV